MLFADCAALLAIAALFGVAWLLVGATVDVPVIDDWVYAWGVEQMVQSGRPQVLDISAIYPIAQILWGALFAKVGGFSFIALRLSTVVLSVLGCWGVYLTLCELGSRRATALLGALGLALHPVFFAMSFSFMTEAPLISVSTLTLWCYVRAIRRNQQLGLWTGGLLAVVAFLVRPIAIALPLALVPALLWRSDWRDAFRRAAVPLGATLAIMIALQLCLPSVFGVLHPLPGTPMREGHLSWWFTVPVTDYLQWNLNLLSVSTFPLVPLLLSYLVHWRRAIAAAAAAIVFVAINWMAMGNLPMPLPDWQTWSLQDIAARAMIGGSLEPSRLSQQLALPVRLLGIVALGSLAANLVQRWRMLAQDAGRVVVGLAAAHLGLINALWLYNDRYYLALAPSVVIIGSLALNADRGGRAAAAIGLALWAAVSLTGTRDMLAFNDACARAARSLELSDIPPSNIDAGYSLNGWRLYAHPERLARGADRREHVPFVTSLRNTRYAIVNRVEPSDVLLRFIPLDRATWQVSHAIYVVRRW